MGFPHFGATVGRSSFLFEGLQDRRRCERHIPEQLDDAAPVIRAARQQVGARHLGKTKGPLRLGQETQRSQNPKKRLGRSRSQGESLRNLRSSHVIGVQKREQSQFVGSSERRKMKGGPLDIPNQTVLAGRWTQSEWVRCCHCNLSFFS